MWLPFEGSRIIVFEDLVPGLKSALFAQKILSEINIDLELLCVGVSNHAQKIEALSPFTNVLTEDINQGIFPEIILKKLA